MCDRCADGMMFFGLAEPQAAMLDSYADALRRGWSPNNVRDVSGEQLAAIAEDPVAFLAGVTEQTGTYALPDGTIVEKLPSMVCWLWDGEFCGVISLRYQPGTSALPPHVSGHIGYAVVPWKRKHGYASRALKQMLAEAHGLGLTEVYLTTDADNIASRIVIERNRGQRAGAWSHPSLHNGAEVERWVVACAG
jgi:predicted acetyltransferase